MALDYLGREIIVEDSVTKKLNVLEGYDELEDLDHVYLCLDYDEEETEMVHSISTGEDRGENHYNRISEGYRLFLTDQKTETLLTLAEHMKERSKVVYNENGLKITHIVPLFVRSGQTFDFLVKVEKSDLPRRIEIDYTLRSDFMMPADGTEALHIQISDEDHMAYKTMEFRYKMKAQAVGHTMARYQVDWQKSKIIVGGSEYALSQETELESEIIEGSVRDAIIARYHQSHFENTVQGASGNRIYLAKFRIIRRKEEYSIIDYEWLPFKQYILSNGMLNLLMNLKEKEVESVAEAAKEQNPNVPLPQMPYLELTQKWVSSGTETIPVDVRPRNQVYFTDELVHGLGAGEVLLQVGIYESSKEDGVFEENKTYFGNADILAGTDYASEIPKVETVAITYPDRGTFRIGVKFHSDCKEGAITLKWWAVKSEQKREADPSEINRVSVQIQPDTVTLSPRERFKFSANILGTDSRECRWKVMESVGGQIDMNGVYEAPTKPGVYEISAESVKYPGKTATAFVVVIER